MKAYPSYKESGAEWIGKIPSEWESIRFKYLFNEIYRYPTYYGISYQNEGILEIRGMMLKSGGIIDATADPRYISLEISNNFPRTQLQTGDLVMSVRGTLGKIGLVTKELEGSNITANIMRLSPKRTKMFPKYLVYLMESDYFANILNFVSDQTTIKTITVPSLVASALPVPSLAEQETIADFLDCKTAQIDTLIEKKQRQIDLLQEQRTTLINHAVTKGLNPDAPMKDSGVEWLGEIPSHWDVNIKLTMLAEDTRNSFVNGPFGSNLLVSELTESGVPVIYIKDVRNGIYKRKSTEHVTPEKALELDSCRVEPGDILIAKVGDPPGATAVYPDGEPSGIVTQDVIRIKN